MSGRCLRPRDFSVDSELFDARSLFRPIEVRLVNVIV
jgi:hypothetical protein